MGDPSAASQLVAVARMLVLSTLNSLRRRQGAGAVMVLALLGTFLSIELARFGGRSAWGVTRVLGYVSPERGLHYGSFWVAELWCALVALKYARVLPGRGARKLFDTPILRALPLSFAARSLGEVIAANAYSAGVVAFVMCPTLWGLARHAHDRGGSLAIVASTALALNAAASLVAVALHEGASRRLAGRALDGARVVAAVMGVGLMGLFTAIGPLGAGLARTLRTGTVVPRWSALIPTRPLVRCVLGDASMSAALSTALLFAAPVALSLIVFAWRARTPADLSLDSPWGRWGAGRWEHALAQWRVELRALGRQAPYIFLATPAFLTFFALLAKGSRSATGADLPLIVLMGLVSWAVVVMGTALSGAASRRWRRVLWIPPTLGLTQDATVRAVAAANLAVTAPLALAPLVVLLRVERPEAWWYPRMAVGLLAALAVGQWAQSSALFLLIDPAPDRLTGLSVGALFGVLAVSLPTAALVVMLSATPFAQWSAALGLFALLAWSLERAATARVRWIRDPDGDPDAARRAWPALRSFGVALLAQVLAMETCGSVLNTSLATGLVAGYAAFALAVVPASLTAWRRVATELTPRWSRRSSVILGALLGALNFAATVAAMKALRGPHEGGASAVAMALSAAPGALRYALAGVAAIVAPAAEEVFFRGWLQHALKTDLAARLRPWSFVLTAAVFAVMHAGEPWAPVFAGALIAGALMERGGRLEGPMAFHLVNNGLSVMVALRG